MNVIPLLQKELRLELRSKQTLAGTLALGVLLSVVAVFGIQSALIAPAVKEKLVAAFIWVISFFATSIYVPRMFEREWQMGGMQALHLRGVRYDEIFLSKALVLSAFTFLSHVLSSATFCLLLNIDLGTWFLSFIGMSVLVLTAYASVLTLLAPLSYHSKLGGGLLVLISLPLLFPLFFSAIELTQNIRLAEPVSLFWSSMLVFLLALYVLLGVTLARYVYHQ